MHVARASIIVRRLVGDPEWDSTGLLVVEKVHLPDPLGRSGNWLCMREGSTMLVLSRKKDESIIINDNIVVTVVEIRRDKVRLGFEAPKDVPIHRREVYEAIQATAMAEEADSAASESGNDEGRGED